MEPAALIVGAGPVGLTMALQLAHYGVPVRIVDKNAGRTDKSKALVLWSRTLELLDRGNDSSAFLEAGLRVNAANIYAGGKCVAHITLDHLQSPHAYALMLPQSDTERILEAHLQALGISVERQVELTGFDGDLNHVSVTLSHADGKQERLSVPWLLGCDGAHSAVRHGLGLTFQGDTLESDWILADLRLDGLSKHAGEINTYWHASGVLAIFPISTGRYRVIADVGDVHGAGRRPDPALADVQAMLDQRGPGGIVGSDPIWLSSFRINERKVKDYRAGRIFLAGDAAHVHSPAGGQGMNTGMQDACNLAWKLAMVHHGLAAEEPLLGSYSIERSAVGEQVLKDAGRLTAVATLRSAPWQFLRNHVASLVFGLSSARDAMAEKLSELSIGYRESPLTLSSHGVHPAAGERAPVMAPTVSTAVQTSAPPRFRLFADDGSSATDVLRRFAALVEPAIQPPLRQGAIWLVRPDGYIAVACQDNGWAEIDQYLARLVGDTASR